MKTLRKTLLVQIKSAISKCKIVKERENLNFLSLNTEKYNLSFKMSELKDSLYKCNDTAAGPDDIYYQILKHLPPDTLETLLNIMNEIWRTRKFPEDWHKVVPNRERIRRRQQIIDR